MSAHTLLVVLMLLSGVVLAQQPAAPAAPVAARGRGPATPPLRSPEVAPDGRVTFRLRAPNATDVAVTGLAQRLAMQKGEDGIWTATTGPLSPDIYTYGFSVDGGTFNDPSNPAVKTAFINDGDSLFRVPGSAAWDPKPGPRGTVSHHFYRSSIIGDDRDYYVYTPPNYDASRSDTYPVLYLLHGLGDDAYGWISVGAANVILDNLINEGKARPMIMVNTLGYGTPDVLTTGRSNLGGPRMLPNFGDALMKEVLPQVEARYRVSKDRRDRAIAGLSMGGAQALFVGLNHLDRFASIASFSGAFNMWSQAAPDDAARFAATFPALDGKAGPQPTLLWVVCGVDDGLMGVNRQFKTWLTSKGVAFNGAETPGFGHVWPLWRRNLAELAPLLFQARR